MIDTRSFASDPATTFYRPLLQSHPLAFDGLFGLLNDPENERSATFEQKPKKDNTMLRLRGRANRWDNADHTARGRGPSGP